MTPGLMVGVCIIRSILPACRRRVVALLVQFPPFGGALDMGQAQPCTSHSAIPPFGGALDMGRARPCASHGAIPPRLVAPSTWAKLNRAPLTAQVPPFGSGDVEVQGVEVAVQGGEVAVRGGVAPKVPTTSATNANNGPSRARWSAIWAQRRLASRGARKEPLNMRVNAFDTHVNLSKCAWAALPTRKSSGPRADQRAHVRVSGPACARVHSSPAPVQG